MRLIEVKRRKVWKSFLNFRVFYEFKIYEFANKHFRRRSFQSFNASTSAVRNFAPIENLIGNTPLLAIHFEFRGQQRTILAKSEHLNPSGGIKDPIALHILIAQKLASELGLAIGISYGANFLGALIAQEKLGAEAVVATIFADDNKKYLSTDLVREECRKSEYLSTEIKLLGYQTIGRTNSRDGVPVH